MKTRHAALSGIAAAVSVLTLLFIALSFVSCGGGSSPSAVTKQFFAAVEKNDTKAMQQTATPELVQMLALFGEKAKETATKNGKITKTTEVIDGDTAKVTVTFANGETTDVDLIKVDGKWKVTADK